MPAPPRDWMPPVNKADRGEPPFAEVDNPVKWHEFTFKAKFAPRTKQYLHHELPTGARPCPPDEDGNREVNGWNFMYEGYQRIPLQGKRFCSGATYDDLFPKRRKGRLDVELLKKHGIKKEDVKNCNALKFFQ